MYDALMFHQLALVCFGGTLAIAAVVGLGMYGAWRMSPEGKRKRARMERDRVLARRQRLDRKAYERALDADRKQRAFERKRMLDEMKRHY